MGMGIRGLFMIYARHHRNFVCVDLILPVVSCKVGINLRS